jgi:hypothetical protein
MRFIQKHPFVTKLYHNLRKCNIMLCERVEKNKKTGEIQMKKFIIFALMVFAMTTNALGIAIIDEDGNIIQENEVLEGGIVPMMGGLDLGDFDFGESIFFPAFGYVRGAVEGHDMWSSLYGGGQRMRVFTEDGSRVHFNIDANTFTMGDRSSGIITGFFDNNVLVPAIYPPQHTAIAIIYRNNDTPRIILDRFDAEWISSDQNFRLSIGDDTEIVFQGGDVFEGDHSELIGRKLLVEFMLSHRDIPETIPNPQRITILYERAVHPILEIDWDYFGVDPYEPIQHTPASDPWDAVSWHGEDSDPENYEILITIRGLQRGVPNARVHNANGLTYLPLRAVTEIMGFVPQWNEQTRAVTVLSPVGEISLNAGNENYTLVSAGGLTLYFTMPSPIIVEGRTYVPLQFFHEAYGFHDTHIYNNRVHLLA